MIKKDLTINKDYDSTISNGTKKIEKCPQCHRVQFHVKDGKLIIRCGKCKKDIVYNLRDL